MFSVSFNGVISEPAHRGRSAILDFPMVDQDEVCGEYRRLFKKRKGESWR